MSTELPPYGLWQWLCGGLNVLDALLVLCWFGLTLTWTYAKSAGRIPRIRGGETSSLLCQSGGTIHVLTVVAMILKQASKK